MNVSSSRGRRDPRGELTCVSTRFCLILGLFACQRRPFTWKFSVFVISSKTENFEFEPVASYNPVELRKFKSDKKITNYQLS